MDDGCWCWSLLFCCCCSFELHDCNDTTVGAAGVFIVEAARRFSLFTEPAAHDGAARIVTIAPPRPPPQPPRRTGHCNIRPGSPLCSRTPRPRPPILPDFLVRSRRRRRRRLSSAVNVTRVLAPRTLSLSLTVHEIVNHNIIIRSRPLRQYYYTAVPAVAKSRTRRLYGSRIRFYHTRETQLSASNMLHACIVAAQQQSIWYKIMLKNIWYFHVVLIFHKCRLRRTKNPTCRFAAVECIISPKRQQIFYFNSSPSLLLYYYYYCGYCCCIIILPTVIVSVYFFNCRLPYIKNIINVY